MTALNSAITLASRGFAVFPCLPTKVPACPHGHRDATRDPAGVLELWGRWPGTLIGTPTGAMNGFDVLDIDPRHGGDAWHAAHRNRLPPTRTHETRSGGVHLLFRHRDGVRNSAGKIAPGIDVRGEGGFVIWWPAAGCPVRADGPPADWPAWLLPLLLPPPARPREAPTLPVLVEYADASRRYAVGALRRAVEEVASSHEGTRNAALNRATFAMMRYVTSGALNSVEVGDAMAAAAVVAGLDAREIAATLASALRAGGAA